MNFEEDLLDCFAFVREFKNSTVKNQGVVFRDEEREVWFVLNNGGAHFISF